MSYFEAMSYLSHKTRRYFFVSLFILVLYFSNGWFTYLLVFILVIYILIFFSVITEIKDFYFYKLKEHAPHLFNSKSYMALAIKKDSSLCVYASEELSADREFVLETVKVNGYFLNFVSEELKSDREIVIEAIKEFPGALEFASKELKEDKAFIEELLKYGINIKSEKRYFKENV